MRVAASSINCSNNNADTIATTTMAAATMATAVIMTTAIKTSNTRTTIYLSAHAHSNTYARATVHGQSVRRVCGNYNFMPATCTHLQATK